MFNYAVLALLVIALLPGGRDAYPRGAPDSVCQTMLPNHGASPQTIESPVTFNVAQGQSFKTGDYIPVTLKTTDVKGFNGFFIQARLVSNPSMIAGMIFSEGLPADMKTVTCGTMQNAVTHSNGQGKTSVTVFWHAAGVKESVVFRATVVRVKAEFWVNVTSTTLTYSATASNFSPNKPEYPSGSATRMSGTSSLLAPLVTVFVVLFK